MWLPHTLRYKCSYTRSFPSFRFPHIPFSSSIPPALSNTSFSQQRLSKFPPTTPTSPPHRGPSPSRACSYAIPLSAQSACLDLPFSSRVGLSPLLTSPAPFPRFHTHLLGQIRARGELRGLQTDRCDISPASDASGMASRPTALLLLARGMRTGRPAADRRRHCVCWT